MPRLSSRIALLTLVGVLSATPAAFAAPGDNGANNTTGPGSKPPIDCRLPANKNLPYCIDWLKKHPAPTTTNQNGAGPNGGMNGSGPNGKNGSGPNQTNNAPGPSNTYKGPKPGTFNFSQQDKSQFHQRFRGLNFGSFSFFLAPNFSITIGANVPSHYHAHLKKVPYSIYKYYPWFRGYYYFIDRKGDFVIVSPTRWRIVAVL